MMDDSLIGRQVGGYLVNERIAISEMSRVYLATRLSNSSIVAMKILQRAHEQDTKHIQRLIREAETIGKLDHPHILKRIDFNQDDDSVYIIMPYLEGGSLAKKLPRGTTLSNEEILAIMEPLLNAVSYVHQNGLIHRDIKNQVIFSLMQIRNSIWLILAL